jgi:hypothetical protein
MDPAPSRASTWSVARIMALAVAQSGLENTMRNRGRPGLERVPGTCEKIGFTDFSTTHFQ